MRSTPKVLILSKGSIENPASRYRHFNMIPYLRQAGFDVDIHPLFEDVYYNSIAVENNQLKRVLRKSLYSVERFIKRSADIPSLGSYDLIVVENQFFPYEQGLLEWLATKVNPRIIVEFDDAIFLTLLHEGKLARTLKMVRHVIVGNPNLAAFARKYNSNVSIVPTVFDIRQYDNLPPRKENAVPAIGWLGQAVGLQYLKVVEGALAHLAREVDFEFRILSKKSLDMPGVNVRHVPWTLESEKTELRALDVGIMPLFDDIWSRHKCAGKLLHYMALGIASAASPVGVNADIIRDGENGFLAADEDQWKEKLKLLITDAVLRSRIGVEGRKTAEEYSLQVWAPKVIELYRRIISE